MHVRGSTCILSSSVDTSHAASESALRAYPCDWKPCAKYLGALPRGLLKLLLEPICVGLQQDQVDILEHVSHSLNS